MMQILWYIILSPFAIGAACVSIGMLIGIGKAIVKPVKKNTH